MTTITTPAKPVFESTPPPVHTPCTNCGAAAYLSVLAFNKPEGSPWHCDGRGWFCSAEKTTHAELSDESVRAINRWRAEVARIEGLNATAQANYEREVWRIRHDLFLAIRAEWHGDPASHLTGQQIGAIHLETRRRLAEAGIDS